MSEFDKFAETYNESLRNSLALTRTSDKYQAEYKVRLLKNLLVRGAAESRSAAQLNVLDFGCGVGLSLPYLLEQFSGSKIFATDVSEVSLDIVRAELPQVTIVDSALNAAEKFDVILMSTVLHHITGSTRVEILENLRANLKPNGCLVVIEHNTYNPLTRRIVSNCPMDVDAELISMRDIKKLFSTDCGFKIRETGYCSFFPEPLKALTKLDPILKKIPLGGQYFVVATP
jgi:2-polyprenyl-3-methyl-5-hydroxy-6-metoxy-1,4-benzoquinol methylase